MARNRSWVVAMADFKAAMELRFVKFGIIGLGSFGPIMVIIMIVSAALLMPPGPDYELFMLFMAPMVATMLALFSVIPASMISANSFVGEKEQNTLEPLLATPLTDGQLLLGKLLASFIPSGILLFGGTAVAIVAGNAILMSFGRPFLLIPDIPGLIFISLAGPAMILAVVSVMILISGRVSRVYEAYQVSMLVALVLIIPMIVPSFFIGSGLDQSVVWMTYIVTILLSAAIMAVTMVLAVKRFNRDTMIRMT
ncbi:MAG: ABC transporter permease subunit [Promethearchaeota archaeon]